MRWRAGPWASSPLATARRANSRVLAVLARAWYRLHPELAALDPALDRWCETIGRFIERAHADFRMTVAKMKEARPTVGTETAAGKGPVIARYRERLGRPIRVGEEG